MLKGKIATFLTDRTIGRLVKMSVILLVFQIIIFLLLLSRLPPVVPLFYSLPWGETQLAPAIYLFFFPAVTALSGCVNVVVAMSTSGHDVFFKRMMMGFWLITTVLSVVGLVKILLLIT